MGSVAPISPYGTVIRLNNRKRSTHMPPKRAAEKRDVTACAMNGPANDALVATAMKIDASGSAIEAATMRPVPERMASMNASVKMTMSTITSAVNSDMTAAADILVFYYRISRI
jgi:hypothetical protein